MKLKQSLLTALLTTTGLWLSSTSANAFTLGGHLTSEGNGADLAYNALFPGNNSDLHTAFVAESRFGDLGGAAEKEFKIFDHQGSPSNEENFAWENGKAYNFKLEFLGALGWTYSLFDSLNNSLLTSVSGQFENAFDTLFIRTRATKDTSVVVDNLFLDGIAVGDQSQVSGVAGDFGVDYLRINDIVDPFVLTGRSTMSWVGTPNPLRSELAYQIKVVDLESVPEPTLVVGLGIGALAMGGLRRRQSFTR